MIAAERGALALGRIVPAEAQAGISAVTSMEYWRGVERAVDPLVRHRRAAFYAHVSKLVDVIDVDEGVALTAARLWAALSVRGTPVGANDLLIAATALHHGWSLATLDVRDFRRIPELDLVTPP